MHTHYQNDTSRWLHSYRTLLVVLSLILLGVGFHIPSYTTPTHAAGTIYYVKEGGSGNCTSWANACDLQTALTAATSGNEIWVAKGTYYPTSGTDRTISFALKNGVAIYGGFAGGETSRDKRDWTTNVTTLSGDIGTPGDASDNSYHVVSSSDVVSTTVLDGFTITAGNAPAGNRNGGGGMSNVNSNPTLTNIIFSDNLAEYGGGMYNETSSPILTNVTFSNNSAIYNGGGMYNDINSNPTLTNVTFSGNSEVSYGGGMCNGNNSNPILTNVTFSNNSAATNGGGMSNYYNSSPILTNVTFSGNSSSHGGGMYNIESSPIIQNSILWGNVATNSGNQIFNENSAPTIRNSLIEGSYASGSWDATLGTDGGNNLDKDPLFVNPIAASNAPTTEGDYRLQADSPALDVGNNEYVQDVATDLDGNIRVINGTVDLGAYEVQSGSGGQDPIVPPPTDPAEIIYVNHAATGKQNGLAWTTAYSNLQVALATARSGNEIWVATGTYTPTSTTDRTISFTLKSDIAIYGGFAGEETVRSERDWRKNETILSGDIGTKDDASDNSYHVVYNSAVNETAILDGFTITGGNADGSSPDNDGGVSTPVLLPPFSCKKTFVLTNICSCF